MRKAERRELSTFNSDKSRAGFQPSTSNALGTRNSARHAADSAGAPIIGKGMFGKGMKTGLTEIPLANIPLPNACVVPALFRVPARDLSEFRV